MDCISYIHDLKVELDMLNDALSACREDKEYQNIANLIDSKEKLMEKYKQNLSKLSPNGIEYRLYIKILNGLSPTKAVEEVADENFINNVKPGSETQIWKYYKNLKKVIKV